MSKLGIDINNENLKKVALFCAVRDNYASTVKKLLSEGADVNARDTLNRTALHQAALINKNESHFEVVKVLLEHGADTNTSDNNGTTPLYDFATTGSARIVRLLLNFGANVNAVNFDGESPLFSAAYNNENVEVLQMLIDLGLDVNQRNCFGQTALLQSTRFSKQKCLEIIKCFLKNHADFNLVDNYESSLLMVESHVFDLITEDIEMKEKIFNFIMENTDFNSDVLSHEYHKSFSDHFWEQIFKHIAKLQDLDIPIKLDYLKKISKKVEYYEYFEQCKEELLRAKNTKLKNSWITFYNLLMDTKKKLKNYAGNEDLMKDFKESECLIKFPIYGSAMVENVNKGIKRRELFDRSSIALSNCLPIFNPNHLIMRDVIDCIMRKKNLLKLCD